MIILTSCAHCAAPLEIMGKKCGRCFTRYCGADCQKAHWKAGHKQMCGQIRLGGGAEKYKFFNRRLDDGHRLLGR